MIGLAPSKPQTDRGQLDALWEDYRLRGDLAVDGLIKAYLPLTRRVLQRISMRLPAHVELEDLSQAALMGLYKSIVAFDPGRGVPFEGYAYPRIRGAVLDELRANDVLSRTKRARVEQAERVVADWMKRHGRMPSEEQIAREMGMEPAAFRQLMEEARPICSLDAGGRDDIPLHETIADPKFAAEDGAHRSDLQQLLRAGFRQLDQREQKILYLYYFEELRLSEIAALFKLTEARISQIHALGVVRLRAALLEHFPSEFAAA